MKAYNFFNNHPVRVLIFSLICGLAYFALIMTLFLLPIAGSSTLIAWFFAPVIICFPAIYIVKYIKTALESENGQGINTIILVHALIIILAIIFTVATILKGVAL